MSSISNHTGTLETVFPFQHPALAALSRKQLSAKFKKLGKCFSTTRKTIISIAAIFLGVIWLGQAVIAILFRSKADPEKLAVWIPFSLLLYTVFHFVKIACKTPEEPFDWTPAEKQLLLSAPVTRTQLIMFRLRSYFWSVVAKAACFTLVMIPDLNNLVAGFVGMVCGLAIVDLIRVLLEVFVFLLKKRERYLFRGIVLVIAISFLATAFVKTAMQPNFEASVASPAALVFVQNFYASLMELTQNSIGKIVVAPFTALSTLILAPQLNLLFFASLASTMIVIGMLIVAIIKVDGLVIRRNKKIERESCQSLLKTRLQSGSDPILNSSGRKSRVPWRFHGAGSIAWYQTLGAIHYRSTIAIALLVPTLLCCIPLLSKQSALLILFNVVGGLVFYSFLLLPSALMLDYRRDVRRLAVWKALPISPLAVTLGQLFVPVAITSAFQLVVLLLTVLLSPISITTVALTWPLLIPLNVFIFGLENIIFLIHPVRRNQEGLEVFLRTILTFTAKGLFFAVAGAIALAGAFVAARVSHNFSNPELASKILFGVGSWIFVSGLALASIVILTRLFDKLDPSQDLPTVS